MSRAPLTQAGGAGNLAGGRPPPPSSLSSASPSRIYATPASSSKQLEGLAQPARIARQLPTSTPPNGTGVVPRPQSNVGARLLKKRQSVAYHPSQRHPGQGPVPDVPSLPTSIPYTQSSAAASSSRVPSTSLGQLAPPVPTSTGRVLNAQQQHGTNAAHRSPSEDQLLATGLDVDQLASEGFKPEDFLKSSLPGGNEEGAARMEDLRNLKSQVESAMKITENELQRSVFNNYADFVIISKEIATLENEMLELKGVLEEWRAVPESLESGFAGDDDLLTGANRRNARNSIADLATLYKSQLSALWEGVEGAQKLVPYVPGRHIITEASTFIELHAATYKPKQPVHLFLLNDAMLVSVKKRRGPGAGSAVRLVAERCLNLSEIVVVDLKDGGDLQNAVKIKRGKETIIFRTDKADDKKMLLLAFKRVAEELMNRKRKEILNEAEARKGDTSGLRHDYDASFSSSEFKPASILGYGKDDPSGKDLSWIGDYSDDLSVAISTRSFEDAVALVVKGKSILPELAANSHAMYLFRAKFDARTSELVSSLLNDLSDPSLRKTGVVAATGWLLRLGQGEHARETFLTARGALLRKRARQIKFEGDISMYISELAMVCFTLIKNTCEWYMAAFKDNRMASGFVRWASAQVEIYAEIFRRQVYGADQDGRVIEESLEVTKAQGAMLRDVGLDFSFLLDGLLKAPPKPPSTDAALKGRTNAFATENRSVLGSPGEEESPIRPDRTPGAAVQMARQSIYESSQGGVGLNQDGPLRPPVPSIPSR